MSELGIAVEEREVAAVAGGDLVYPVVLVRTLAHRALRTIRHDFYRPRKVVPAWLADRLNARMLAFWFMDDGYTRIRGGGRRPLAEIATNAFSDADLQVLISGLANLGLPAKASRRRLYFDVHATERLSELIAPYVPQVMRYKLHPDVEARVPFDRARLARGPRMVDYDEVEVQDITAHKRDDVTFFCIDVEGTHNFVTAGGVVHNCRPPGNRDPLPIEIQNCQEYLLRQVELIQPTVICTLGNFSTKLLRGDPTGITRLHGQPEVIVLGRAPCACIRSTIRPPRSTRRGCSRHCARTSCGCPSCSRSGRLSSRRRHEVPDLADAAELAEAPDASELGGAARPPSTRWPPSKGASAGRHASSISSDLF